MSETAPNTLVNPIEQAPQQLLEAGAVNSEALTTEQAEQVIAGAEKITQEAAQNSAQPVNTESTTPETTEAPKGFTVVDKRSGKDADRIEVGLEGVKIRDYEPKHDVLANGTPDLSISAIKARSDAEGVALANAKAAAATIDLPTPTAVTHDMEPASGSDEQSPRAGRIKRAGQRITAMFKRNKNSDFATVVTTPEPIAASDIITRMKVEHLVNAPDKVISDEEMARMSLEDSINQAATAEQLDVADPNDLLSDVDLDEKISKIQQFKYNRADKKLAKDVDAEAKRIAEAPTVPISAGDQALMNANDKIQARENAEANLAQTKGDAHAMNDQLAQEAQTAAIQAEADGDIPKAA